MGQLLNEITAIRFYLAAWGVVSGRSGHVSKGPKRTLWAGLREIAKSMQRLHRGELKADAPRAYGLEVDVAAYVKKLEEGETDAKEKHST